ncbi:MAG TPA: hypothetical protein VNS09_21115 [Solirubrobacter sp.]|nr:hypothetical protein [Solirubrobacter sp.]
MNSLPLAEIGGVTVTLSELVATENTLKVKAAAVPNEVTERLDAKYHAAFRRWADQRSVAGSEDVLPPPPRQPAELLLALQVSVTDDIGTDYALVSRQAGGTGTDWDAEWTFRPTVPAGASEVTLAAIGTPLPPIRLAATGLRREPTADASGREEL